MKLLEVHILQNVAPACLNRDDTGSPKDALFGGVRRARLSSQSQKRAVRLFFREVLVPLGFFSAEDLALRTKRLVKELVSGLKDKGRGQKEAEAVVRLLVNGIFKPKNKKGDIVNEEGMTQYLLFLGKREISNLVQKIDDDFEVLKKETDKKEPKLPDSLRKEFEICLHGGRSADLALFGRMLADRPEWNVDAACQVAHAISTHKVDREFDFYTAVDDLNPAEETGAGMMGDVEFVSACFYRYADLNLDLLLENLGEDRDLALKTALAFVEAFVKTLPSGKQNTFAAHNPPDFVAVRLSRADIPRNLANAFVPSVWVHAGEDLVDKSVKRLEAYWKGLDKTFGHPENEKIFVLQVKDFSLEYLNQYVQDNFQGLLSGVESTVSDYLRR